MLVLTGSHESPSISRPWKIPPTRPLSSLSLWLKRLGKLRGCGDRGWSGVRSRVSDTQRMRRGPSSSCAVITTTNITISVQFHIFGASEEVGRVHVRRITSMWSIATLPESVDSRNEPEDPPGHKFREASLCNNQRHKGKVKQQGEVALRNEMRSWTLLGRSASKDLGQ